MRAHRRPIAPPFIVLTCIAQGPPNATVKLTIGRQALRKSGPITPCARPGAPSKRAAVSDTVAGLGTLTGMTPCSGAGVPGNTCSSPADSRIRRCPSPHKSQDAV